MTSLSDVFEWRHSSRRIWVDCSGFQSSDHLDRVCQILLKRGFGVVVLDDCPGALISNISILENLWLPQAWCRHTSSAHFRLGLSKLDDVIAPMLPQSWPALTDLLLLRPGQLSSQQRSLVVLLRAVLMEPELVLLSSDWISGLVDSFGHTLMEMMHLLLSRPSWLAFDELEPMVDGLSTGWTRTQLLSL